jgi:1-aminocyclopropane-1-carboxylate deaminase
VIELSRPELVPLKDELFEEKKLKVYVLRLDLIHSFVSGNKWHKLKYNVEEFKRLGKEYLVTFGGAYSNHIVATAAAGKAFEIKTVGIIRGEELTPNSNEVLQFASKCGMQLVFVSRDEYRKLKTDDNLVYSKLNRKPQTSDPKRFIVPEGGSNEFALKGCTEIVNNIPVPFDHVIAACGTGMTLAGIAKSVTGNQKAIGISVLHGEDFLEKDIREWSGSNDFKMNYDYCLGGYAKSNHELETFCNDFYFKHHFRIEPVYTGKLFYGLYDLIIKDFFPHGNTIVAIHSGGIFDFTEAL